LKRSGNTTLRKIKTKTPKPYIPKNLTLPKNVPREGESEIYFNLNTYYNNYKYCLTDSTELFDLKYQTPVNKP